MIVPFLFKLLFLSKLTFILLSPFILFGLTCTNSSIGGAEEGNLISKIKGITEENYTMEEYVYKIEDIIKTKLKYFQDLKQKIKAYKSLLG